MTVSVAELDGMSASQAAGLFRECCGSERWVAAMVERRPFETIASVTAAADEIWESLSENDWREAFACHPRIGERSPTSVQGRGWAASEQSGMERAVPEVRDAVAAANREYEERFGYIYIVCATGRTAEEMLDLARTRLQNDAGQELRMAAEEQRKITRIRLDKLLDKGSAP